jgi:hypothetical protein
MFAGTRGERRSGPLKTLSIVTSFVTSFGGKVAEGIKRYYGAPYPSSSNCFTAEGALWCRPLFGFTDGGSWSNIQKV